MITINKALNIVAEIQINDTPVYFHSMPLIRETVKQYHLVLSKVFSQIYQQGLSITAGPRVAAMMLEDTAKDTMRSPGINWWDGQDGVQNGLLNEIKRLTNVIAFLSGKWDSVPLSAALSEGLISVDDWYEAEGEIVFFMLASAMHSRQELPGILAGMTTIWGGQTTSSNCTEFAASLPTLTAIKNTATAQ